MRDLKRRNANKLAVHQLAGEGVEVFTPMMEMMMTIGGRRQRRQVPVIQDLLFAHEEKSRLDALVAKYPNLQYRFFAGQGHNQPTVISDEEMDRFMKAVGSTDAPKYFRPGELTKSMYGKKVRIIGGPLSSCEGRLLSVKGMRKRYLIMEIPGFISAAVEVAPEYVEILP